MHFPAGPNLQVNTQNVSLHLLSSENTCIGHTRPSIKKSLCVHGVLCGVCGILVITTVEMNEVAQSCPTLCDPMDCSLSGSSVHGIFQARILEWVVISFSRDLPDPGIKPESLASPVLAGGFFRV